MNCLLFVDDLLLLQELLQQAANHGAQAVLLFAGAAGAAGRLAAAAQKATQQRAQVGLGAGGIAGAAAQKTAQQRGNIHIAQKASHEAADAGAAAVRAGLLAQQAHKQRCQGRKDIAGLLGGNAGLCGNGLGGILLVAAQQMANDLCAVFQVYIGQEALDIGGISLGVVAQSLGKAFRSIAALGLALCAAQQAGKHSGNYLFNILLRSAGSFAQALNGVCAEQLAEKFLNIHIDFPFSYKIHCNYARFAEKCQSLPEILKKKLAYCLFFGIMEMYLFQKRGEIHHG